MVLGILSSRSGSGILSERGAPHGWRRREGGPQELCAPRGFREIDPDASHLFPDGCAVPSNIHPFIMKRMAPHFSIAVQ